MSPCFIPPDARPPVNQELAREAWEVAAMLEAIAGQRMSGETATEVSNGEPDE